MFTRC